MIQSKLMKLYIRKSLIVFVVIILATTFCYLYYPQQMMPVGCNVYVETPEPQKYRNDCLHPCIRYDSIRNEYHMAQSPYYGGNIELENPMYYRSGDYMRWSNGVVLAETPESGYNSDPCIMLLDDTIIYTWRECNTPLCDSLGCINATVGGFLKDGKLTEKRVMAVNYASHYDLELCPIIFDGGVQCLDNRYGRMVMYAAWYQYQPKRLNKGVALWSAKSVDELDFCLIDTMTFASIYTADKWKRLNVMGRMLYLPKSQKHKLWHFDLFEYNGKLYMVSVAEQGDNIMLSVTEDGLRFKTFRKPLINNHYMENYTGYRQYYYKPTAFVKNDSLFLFYTANAKDDPCRNQLFVTRESMIEVIKQID